MTNLNTMLATAAVLFSANLSHAVGPEYEIGKEAIHKMAGCFIVDYNYAETQGLKPDYVRDSRVYDVNKDKTVKEWIYVEDISPTKFRVQHILFMTDKNGVFKEKAILRHQAEDWEYEAKFLYEFVGPNTWNVKSLEGMPGKWVRRITNLDDGLRYQCASEWTQAEFPQWSCDTYSPIPGRETRDMGRHDYNTLQRSSSVVVYGESWLERQENIKTVDEMGKKTPLAAESGKHWYVRRPEGDCQKAQEFAKPRLQFWNLLRETWDLVLTGEKPFVEKAPEKGQPPRFTKIWGVEGQFLNQDLGNSGVRQEAQKKILEIIDQYRLH